MALTEKQNRFVNEYLVDLNGKQAAIRAGYAAGSAEVEASRLLRSAKVSAAIDQAQKSFQIGAARHGITADRVLAELGKIAFADIRKIVQWRSDGIAMIENEDGEEQIVTRNEVTLVSSGDLSEDVAATISEVSQSPNGALKVKLHDKHAALVDLAKHLGLFNQAGSRGGAVKVGKKDLANQSAEQAGTGTEWGDDLQIGDAASAYKN